MELLRCPSLLDSTIRRQESAQEPKRNDRCQTVQPPAVGVFWTFKAGDLFMNAEAPEELDDIAADTGLGAVRHCRAESPVGLTASVSGEADRLIAWRTGGLNRNRALSRAGRGAPADTNRG